MIKPSTQINVFKTDIAANKNFFTGSLDLQTLDFDPLVTGYAFIKWVTLPSWVTKVYPQFAALTEKNFKEFGGLSDIELQTFGVTHGFNANEFHVAGGIQKQNTEFTLKHQEFSGSPMKNMYQYWISGIRDPETGIATYPKIHGMDYATANHTGELIYIVTRPDANNVDKNNIEFAAYYTAVMPKAIRLSHFNHTIGTHDQVEYDQSFSGDFHMSAKVDEFAKKVLKERVQFGFAEMGEFDPVNVVEVGGLDHGYDDSASVGSYEVDKSGQSRPE